MTKGEGVERKSREEWRGKEWEKSCWGGRKRGRGKQQKKEGDGRGAASGGERGREKEGERKLKKNKTKNRIYIKINMVFLRLSFKHITFFKIKHKICYLCNTKTYVVIFKTYR